MLNVGVVCSDHSALYLEWRGDKSGRPARKFIFENSWLLDENCDNIVNGAWQNSKSFSFTDRIRQCGEELLLWGGAYHQNFRKKKNLLRGIIDGLKANNSLEAHMELMNTEQLLLLLSQEEVYWKQCAKQHWLTAGDGNTRFFHHYASSRRKKNQLLRLRDDNGEWVEGPRLHEIILKYFNDIFTSNGCCQNSLDELNFPQVSTEQNEVLEKPFTSEEVKAAVFSMKPDKAPGPDGMNPMFFQHFWPTLGDDVTQFINQCLETNTFPSGFGDANIVLIPKKQCAEGVADLRPIALCNTSYKIMAKILANRMKDLLQNIISDTQCAFVPDRLITDNVLIAAETGHYLRRKMGGTSGWAGLKLDMAKAYDRMEWGFVRFMLSKFGFGTKWIEWIMLCVTLARYRFRVNDDLVGPLEPTRGLRQGDPLSPYLFIICSEGLAGLLKRSQVEGSIHGCRVAIGAPAVTHLMFADDCLVFFKANPEEANEVKQCLTCYEQASGQIVNFHKSSICFSTNTTAQVRELVSNILQVQQTEGFGKYLGLPYVVGRNKRMAFNYIEQKMRHRIGTWQKKLLSKARKEILLKCVAQALPTYTMSVYLLPNSFCDNLQKVMNKYWWQSSGNGGNGIH